MSSLRRGVLSHRRESVEAEIRDWERVVADCEHPRDIIDATKQLADARQRLASIEEAEAVATAKTPLDRVRRLRAIAVSRGAHTAAKDLQRDENRLMAEAARARRSEDPTVGMSEEELADYLRQEGAGMPSVHLRVLVDLYCEREGYELRRLVIAGGVS